MSLSKPRNVSLLTSRKNERITIYLNLGGYLPGLRIPNVPALATRSYTDHVLWECFLEMIIPNLDAPWESDFVRIIDCMLCLQNVHKELPQIDPRRDVVTYHLRVCSASFETFKGLEIKILNSLKELQRGEGLSHPMFCRLSRALEWNGSKTGRQLMLEYESTCDIARDFPAPALVKMTPRDLKGVLANHQEDNQLDPNPMEDGISQTPIIISQDVECQTLQTSGIAPLRQLKAIDRNPPNNPRKWTADDFISIFVLMAIAILCLYGAWNSFKLWLPRAIRLFLFIIGLADELLSFVVAEAPNVYMAVMDLIRI